VSARVVLRIANLPNLVDAALTMFGANGCSVTGR
jgi:hypothetical protein